MDKFRNDEQLSEFDARHQNEATKLCEVIPVSTADLFYVDHCATSDTIPET